MNKSLLMIFISMYSLNASSQIRFIAPSEFNNFIANPNISWAAETYPSLSFSDNLFRGNKSIYDYIIAAKKKGTIKSYLRKYNEDIAKSKNKKSYFQTNKFYDDKEDYKNYNLDSFKRIEFHEILYIRNHKLYTYVISAAPVYSNETITRGGLAIHNSIKSYCCLNKSFEKTLYKSDSIIFLKRINRIIRMDSIELFSIIKKTYLMDLNSVLWYDLSEGYNELVDIKKNIKISATNIMDYSIVDSLSIPQYDSLGNIIANKKFPNEPVMYWIPNLIEVEEDWYYNITKNIFLPDIKHAYLFSYPNSDLNEDGSQKRFKIAFK